MRILITPFQTLLTEYFVNKENDISSNRNIIYKSINDLTLYVDNYIKYNKQYNTSHSYNVVWLLVNPNLWYIKQRYNSDSRDITDTIML